MIYAVRPSNSLENPLKLVKREKLYPMESTERLPVQKEIYFLCGMARTLQFLFTVLKAQWGPCHLELLRPMFLAGWRKESQQGIPHQWVRQRQRGSPLARLTKNAAAHTAVMTAVTGMSLLGQQIKSAVCHWGKDSLCSVVLHCALQYKAVWGAQCVVFPSISRSAT